MAIGWIIVCPLGESGEADAMGDSTLYIESAVRKKLKNGGENLPPRPSDGTKRDTVASGWLDDENNITEFASQPWYPYRNRIGHVEILNPWTPKNGKYLFDGLGNCKEFDLLKLDTSACRSFEGMFRGCSSVTQLLDLDRFDTSNVESVSHMFLNCLELRAISVVGWDVSSIENCDHMLAGCTPYVLSSEAQRSLVEKVVSVNGDTGTWRRPIG